ncbi:cylicin-1-like [Cucurbita maxima]|uniref:Cylicin-1-like n=1 Tax=Cucurbita maxima TaxID=3661 RepID=A0A6J1JCJ7_CUCMA|nr:cylicin-1-like [Cucurbita maxima]XP_022986895.1 cylicin-1-like [Cucurbita maxima]XP_022986896.1 cylicin-1-like [Cucurbita maxima]
MKTVTGSIVSSKPISISKAASTLSSFLSVDNGASKAICAYLRRASASFNELKQLHKELKSSRSDRKHRHHGSEASNDPEAARDNPQWIEDGEKKNPLYLRAKDGKSGKTSLNVQSEDGKAEKESGGNGDFEDASGEYRKRKVEDLKTEIEDKPNRKVEMDVESSDKDKSVVAVEKKGKKHQKKSEDRYAKIEDDEHKAGARRSSSKSRNSDNNGEIEASAKFVENNIASGKDRKKHVDKKSLGDDKDQVKSEGHRRRDAEEEKSTNKDNDDGTESSKKKKKKKKKKKNREEEDDDFQNNSGGALVKEEIPVLDDKELKRKEKKKRKNRDLEEGGDDGSEEQQRTKRRKGNL